MTLPVSVTINQAAIWLGVSKRTVYYRIRDGRLETKRAGKSTRVLVGSILTLRPADAGLTPEARAALLERLRRA